MVAQPNGSAGIVGLIAKQGKERSRPLQNAARAALLLLLVLAGCSALSQPKEDTPASGPDPAYTELVAGHLKSSFAEYASYDAFEISDFRWVHSIKGWSWLVCVRFQNKGRRLTYALFIKQKEVIDSRYAVETDGCGGQTYAPFAPLTGLKGPESSDALGPLH